MEYRQFGRTGVQVSPLCLGAMMFGAWGNPDHDESVRIIHRALDAGINFIDTADVYSRGESEEIVGKALAGGRRDNVILATKVHGTMGDDPNEFGNSRRWIIREVENSLTRLNTDWIDLYQIHRPELETTDLDETLGALTDLVRAGKVRYIGSSTFPASQIVEAQWVAERRGRERFVVRAAAVLDPGAWRGERRASHLPASRDGGDPVEPARRRMADRPVSQGRRGSAYTSGRADPGSLRHVAARESSQARRGRCAGQAGRRDRDEPDRDGDRVRHRAPGGDRRDHRAADDGAARVPASGRPTASCPTRCSTGSTRSSRPA